jgi:Xaa-Pro dipeptidase
VRADRRQSSVPGTREPNLTRWRLLRRDYFREHAEVTGAQLFAEVGRLPEAVGWEFGGSIAGHLVGQFPHEKIAGDEIESYVAPGSDQPMRRLDRTGKPCHWILEVDLVDRERQIGGFFEELLDLGG